MKKITYTIASLAIAGSVLFSGQGAALAAGSGLYPVQKTGGAGLDIRTTPTINGKRTEVNIPDGKKLWLYCYVKGQSYKGSKIWNYVDDNGYGGEFDYGYAPDYFIKTGTSKPVVNYCSF
jgi:hypothetical protein